MAALAPATRQSMADSAVGRCLGTLTSAGAGVLAEPWSIDPSLPAAVDLAAALRAAAERDIARARVASRFGELGLDALSAAALDVAGEAPDAPEAVRAALAHYGEQRRLPDLARAFVAQDMAYAFRYFAERDVPPHLGGPRLRTVADATRLVDDIAGLCQSTTSSLEFSALEEQLGRAVGEGGAPGHPLYQAVAAQALHDSLRALGGLT